VGQPHSSLWVLQGTAKLWFQPQQLLGPVLHWGLDVCPTSATQSLFLQSSPWLYSLTPKAKFFLEEILCSATTKEDQEMEVLRSLLSRKFIRCILQMRKIEALRITCPGPTV
jgi:hypothetical protein